MKNYLVKLINDSKKPADGIYIFFIFSYNGHFGEKKSYTIMNIDTIWFMDLLYVKQNDSANNEN